MTPLAQLVVEVTLLQQQIYAGGECRIKVTLRNAGTEKVVVNSRLSVGYRNSTSRELFADLTTKSDGKAVSFSAVDYDRNFPSRSDFRALPAGESLSATFDLFEWYAPPGAGVYELVVYYQADEALAKPPEGVAKGIYSSKAVELAVLPVERQQK